MAGDWLHMRLDLPEDPAVIGIADRLGIDALDVVGRLYAVWCWFDQQTADGQMKNLSRVRLLSEVNQRAKLSGFAEAMAAERWLGEHGIPKFDRWMGESAKKRLRNARYQQASRDRQRVRQTSDEKPDEKLTRVEKSRVEKSRVEKEIKTFGASQKRAMLVERFDALWKRYPTRDGKKGPKQPALTRFLSLPEADRQEAEKGLERYSGAAGEHPVDCVRYLRNRRWEDEITEDASAAADAAFWEERRRLYGAGGTA